MFTLINGSSKMKESNSQTFLNYILKDLDLCKVYSLKKDKFEDIARNIKLSEAIVIAFPLYVDAPNSLTLSFLEYLIDNKVRIENKKVYTIINCGFREGKHNLVAANIIRLWCNKVKAIYSGSILIGAGEIVGKSKCKIISKDVLTKLKKFAFIVNRNDTFNDCITTAGLLNNKMFMIIANISWYKTCKSNGLTKKEINGYKRWNFN